MSGIDINPSRFPREALHELQLGVSGSKNGDIQGWPAHLPEALPLWSVASSACDGTDALPDVRPLGRVDGGAGIPDVQGGRESRGKSRCWMGTSGFIPPDWRGFRLVP
jgi:hypothetical protein